MGFARQIKRKITTARRKVGRTTSKRVGKTYGKRKRVRKSKRA